MNDDAIRQVMEHWPAACPNAWAVVDFRQPRSGEFYLSTCGHVQACDYNGMIAPWPIVRQRDDWGNTGDNETTYDCLRCFNSCGEVDCPHCNATGTNQAGNECALCEGTCVVPCPDCNGDGFVGDEMRLIQLETENDILTTKVFELEVRLERLKTSHALALEGE